MRILCRGCRDIDRNCIDFRRFILRRDRIFDWASKVLRLTGGRRHRGIRGNGNDWREAARGTGRQFQRDRAARLIDDGLRGAVAE